MVCCRCGGDGRFKERYCQICSCPLGHPCSNGAGSGGSSTGLDQKTAALLSYVLGWLTGIILYFIERNKFVRFHAMQSILTFGSVTVIQIIIGIIRGIAWGIFWRTGGAYLLWSFLNIISTIVWIGTLVLWIVLMVKAYQGEQFKLPLVGPIAEKQLK